MSENIFKQSAKLLKNNILVLQPLFFWVLVMMIVLAPISAKSSIDIGFIMSASIGFLCFTAFLAGWYNCIKGSVANKNIVFDTPEEKNKAQFDILKSFFPGVADYILPVTVYTLIYIICAYFTAVLYRVCAFKIFDIKAFPSDMFKVLNTGTQEEIAKYLQTNLSHDQIFVLGAVLIAAFAFYIIFSVAVLWLGPVIFYTGKNPITVVSSTFKFLFNNFGISILIVVVMFLLNTVISFTNIFIGNGLLAFIPILLSFVYIMYYVMTVFLYYESKTQNNCTCGSKLDRQV